MPFLTHRAADHDRLQLDTPANIALFPVWQEYLRTRHPKSLIVWGKGDRFFLPASAAGSDS
jgi:hypothetical protein